MGAISGAASPNKWAFLLTRLVTGACIGTNFSCLICYSTEFAESKYRAYGVMVGILSAFAGLVAVNGVAYLTLDMVGWRWFIIIVSTPSVPALIFILVLPESPRFLCVSGQQDKAMQAVRFMARLNGKKIPENAQMVCFDDEDLGSYSMIVDKDHRKSIVTLSIVYFTNIFIEFGFIMLLPLLFSTDFCGTSQSIKHKCQSLTQGSLLKLTIATVGGVLGSIAASISAQHIGRLLSIRMGSFVMLLSLASLFICVNGTFIFVTTTIAKTAEAFINTTIWIMVPESFPTIIRSTASGFINGWGKLGGVVGTTCVYLLFYVSSYLVIGLFLFCSLIGFVAIIIYDRETRYEVLEET
jgi:MFS family permease